MSRVGEPILREVRARLQFLDQVGLGYISIDRSAAALSGGGLSASGSHLRSGQACKA